MDEAQDLSSAHWMLLRAMVGRGSNDLFLVGDTHQRIYDNYVSLGSLGIEIRGRSSRLTLTYRSTHEILTAASRILGTESWDDMDDGTDTLDGYRSVLRGPQPEFQAYGSWQDELDGILSQVRKWTGGDTSIAVSVPTKKQVEQVESYLTAHDVPAGSIGPDGPRLHDGVHVGTLQRFKGLEYQRMILAGITDAAVPGQRAAADPAPSAARAYAGPVAPVRRGHPGTRHAGNLLERAAQPFPPPGGMSYALITPELGRHRFAGTASFGVSGGNGRWCCGDCCR